GDVGGHQIRHGPLLAPQRGQRLAQGHPLHVLHGDEVGPVRLAELVDLDDVRVQQQRRDLRLSDEHRLEVARLREAGEDPLQDQLALEPLGSGHEGPVDLGHPPFADAPEQLVTTEHGRGENRRFHPGLHGLTTGHRWLSSTGEVQRRTSTRRGFITPLASPILRERATVDPGHDDLQLVGRQGGTGGLALAERPRDRPTPRGRRQDLADEVAARRVEGGYEGQVGDLARGDVDQGVAGTGGAERQSAGGRREAAAGRVGVAARRTAGAEDRLYVRQRRDGRRRYVGRTAPGRELALIEGRRASGERGHTRQDRGGVAEVRAERAARLHVHRLLCEVDLIALREAEHAGGQQHGRLADRV